MKINLEIRVHKQPDFISRIMLNLFAMTITPDKFMCEVLSCGTCNKAFSLRENKLSALCGGCNKFLHCGIAGKCVGPNCGNSFHRLTWCKKCVPKTVSINLLDMDEGTDCLCQECLDDPVTHRKYKKKI
mgnify:CR=1 FL=1